MILTNTMNTFHLGIIIKMCTGLMRFVWHNYGYIYICHWIFKRLVPKGDCSDEREITPEDSGLSYVHHDVSLSAPGDLVLTPEDSGTVTLSLSGTTPRRQCSHSNTMVFHFVLTVYIWHYPWKTMVIAAPWCPFVHIVFVYLYATTRRQWAELATS